MPVIYMTGTTTLRFARLRFIRMSRVSNQAILRRSLIEPLKKASAGRS